jgi:hypothetical protein
MIWKNLLTFELFIITVSQLQNLFSVECNEQVIINYV